MHDSDCQTGPSRNRRLPLPTGPRPVSTVSWMFHECPRRVPMTIEEDGVVPAAVHLLLDQPVVQAAVDGRTVRDHRHAPERSCDHTAVYAPFVNRCNTSEDVY